MFVLKRREEKLLKIKKKKSVEKQIRAEREDERKRKSTRIGANSWRPDPIVCREALSQAIFLNSEKGRKQSLWTETNRPIRRKPDRRQKQKMCESSNGICCEFVEVLNCSSESS
jgi:hypothetical protein